MAGGTFPFLELPTEIRLVIYKLVLPYSEYDYGCGREKSDCPVVWYPGKSPGILFVNRQISQEATELLYRENTFSVYVRHPREPRLPMNESRADPESFLLISWAKRAWSNPRNPRLPFSTLKDHSNLQNIRRIHVSLPPFDDLLGVDVYMQKSSYAAFHGINAWIRKHSETGGCVDQKDQDRLDYVRQIKEPIDEVAALLRTLPRIDQLHLSLQAREREIGFAEYMVARLLTLRNVHSVRAFYVPRYVGGREDPWVWGNPDDRLLLLLRAKLEDPAFTREESHLPTRMDEMVSILQAIRTRQQLDPTTIPIWLYAMPE